MGELLTRREVAAELGCTVRTVAALARRGKLQRVRLDGRTVRFRRTDVMDLAAKSTRALASSDDTCGRDPRDGDHDRGRRPE